MTTTKNNNNNNNNNNNKNIDLISYQTLREGEDPAYNFITGKFSIKFLFLNIGAHGAVAHTQKYPLRVSGSRTHFVFVKRTNNNFKHRKGRLFLSPFLISDAKINKTPKKQGSQAKFVFFWILIRAFTFFRDVLKPYFIFFWILFRE